MSLSAHIRKHVVGYVAVFLALTGSAHALAGTNTVDSGDIVPSGVTTPDVGLNAVAGVNIEDGTVASPDLVNEAVRRVDLTPAAVNSAKVANGSLNLDEFAPDTVRSRVTGTCGNQAWRYFRLTENFFNCASAVHAAKPPFTAFLPGWEVGNGCTGPGNPLLRIESTENFATVNWFYSDGVALHTGGTALGESEHVLFNQSPIWGQFILSTPGDGSSVPANSITLTFEGATCPATATTVLGLL